MVDGAGQAGGGEDIFLLVPFYNEAVTVPRVSPVMAPAKLHLQEGSGVRGMANPAGPQRTGRRCPGDLSSPQAAPFSHVMLSVVLGLVTAHGWGAAGSAR